jgi:hypothetical protein
MEKPVQQMAVGMIKRALPVALEVGILLEYTTVGAKWRYRMTTLHVESAPTTLHKLRSACKINMAGIVNPSDE